jgi:hypothetical protein
MLVIMVQIIFYIFITSGPRVWKHFQRGSNIIYTYTENTTQELDDVYYEVS